ncbi:TIGR03617 family F420-dependent LLM class oxidoreductase [Mycobacterium sp. GA-2829]|uniref:TIGR03617 family F420-dependent LLM class oxidoreductase n=1 Tax=Mycobacterium sp. GA-2829 TaxID=1772283 RepID=UPI0007404C13|nr:TIGR03617 family F420-dependent LLM class oxidoreductase [Mycobacterium sp. GA-2829]KUI29325.1 hypothetical protein AU194_20875 [Mycobacterium sp. GA-2829]
MHLDAFLWDAIALEQLPTIAGDLERIGYDALWAGEVQHDPFLQLSRIAETAKRVTLGTAIAVASSRSPITMAHLGWDMQRYTAGRFILGLGSSTRLQVEERYGMPWGRPAARMADYAAAVRAVWAAWDSGEPLNHRGPFYRHTLMLPNFTPPRHDYGPPPLYLAAVGPKMVTVAGESFDGVHLIGFQSAAYLREVTVPALTAARAAVGKTMDDFVVNTPVVVTAGRNDEELETATAEAKHRLAYYLSVPDYRPMLAHHGWEDVQTELAALQAAERYDEMAARIPNEVWDAYVLTGTPSQIAVQAFDRLYGIVDRISMVSMASAQNPISEMARELAAAFRDEKARRTEIAFRLSDQSTTAGL